MFYDIKDRLSDPIIQRTLSYCLFDRSFEGINKALSKYQGEQFYAWNENNELLGICGFCVLQDKVKICHIAVNENTRNKGIGRHMVNALRDMYGMDIEAETDDEAVGFYRKCGFTTTAMYKQYGTQKIRRWNCLLPVVLPYKQETDKKRQARIYPVILSEHNTAWAEWFIEEKMNLERMIGIENIVGITHFGSTSVPGLAAKPTVDILLEIIEEFDTDKLIAALPSPEYICLNPPDMITPPPHLMFLKGYTSTGFAERVYHIHVRYPGDWDELYFRDYLIAHPETAAEYAALKRRLHKQYKYNRDGYTVAKGEFVRAVTEKARKEATR